MSGSKGPIRIGVVGVGDVAQRDYLPEFHRVGDIVELVAVGGLREDRVRATAKQYGVPSWFIGYRDLVADDSIDAILNLTPVPLHAEVTQAGLEAGKHVYSEKPLASGPSDARRLGDLAATQGLVLAAAPSVMLFPQVVRAREILASGSLGPVHAARAFAFGGVPPWEGYASDPSPFFAAGSGPLVDMGVYPLHALTGLLGPISWVAAASSRTRDSFIVGDGPVAGTRVGVESDDNWHLLLRFAGGTLASIEANFCTAPALGPECQLLGERASLGFSLLDVSAPLMIDNGVNVTEESVPHERAGGPDHILGVRHLAECVLQERAPAIGASQAVHVIDVLDAARRSAAEGKGVEVTSVF